MGSKRIWVDRFFFMRTLLNREGASIPHNSWFASKKVPRAEQW
jgi:hypothetical protein